MNIIKILEFYMIIIKYKDNHRILVEHIEKTKNLRILCSNFENHENNYANNENHGIPFEKHEYHENH